MHGRSRESMKARLLWLMLCMAGHVPLRVLRGIARLLVPVLIRTRWREKRVSELNLERCLPELSVTERKRLLRESLYHVLCSAFELPRLWTRPVAGLMREIEQIEGGELLTAALESGQGVLIAAPHLGAWELLNLYLAEQREIGVLYRAPHRPWLEAVMNKARSRSRAVPIRAEAAAVRAILKRLSQGGMVGILPDQKPKQGEGEFAPMFGIDAMTMTLFPKLAQKPAVQVLFAFVLRTERGFALHIRAPEPEVSDTRSLNQNLERCARTALAQYQWSYKRYSMRPPGEARIWPGAKFYP